MESFKLSSSDSEGKKKEGTSPIAQAVLALLILGGGGWFYFGGGLEQQTQRELGELHDQVAVDFTEQYRIAQKSGDVIQICVQAMSVSAAYLQAQDEPNYLRWKEIEKADCAKAGMAQ